MKQQDAYHLTLRPLPDPSDPEGVRRLRRGLKYLLRVCGLRCVNIQQGGGEPQARPQRRPAGAADNACGARTQ